MLHAGLLKYRASCNCNATKLSSELLRAEEITLLHRTLIRSEHSNYASYSAAKVVTAPDASVHTIKSLSMHSGTGSTTPGEAAVSVSISHSGKAKVASSLAVPR
jgi:hypothetical protein